MNEFFSLLVGNSFKEKLYTQRYDPLLRIFPALYNIKNKNEWRDLMYSEYLEEKT